MPRWKSRSTFGPANPIIKLGAKFGLGEWTKSVLGGVVGGFISDFLGLGGHDGPSMEEFNALKDAFNDFANETKNHINALHAYVEANSAAIDVLDARADAVDAYIASAQNQAQNFQDMLSVSINSARTFEQQVNNAFATTNEAIRQTQNANAATLNYLNQALIAVDSQIRNSFWALSNATANNTAAIQRVVTELNSQMVYVNNYLRALTRADRDILGTISELNLDSRRMMAVTIGVLTKIADTTAEGRYNPFLNNWGVAPSQTPEDYAEFVVQHASLFYQGSLPGGNRRVIELQTQLICSTIKIVGSPRGYMQYRDFLEMLGPDGCEITGSCSCYIVYSKFQCTLNPSGLGFNYLFTNNVSTITNTTESVTKLCSASPAVITLQEAVVVTNISGLETMFNDRCSEQIAGTSVILLQRDMGLRINTSYGLASQTCSFDTATFMDTTTVYPGPEWNFMKLIETSFGWNYKRIATTYKAIAGGVPQGLTYYQDPFALRDGLDANCITGSWMSYSNVLVPVYKLDSPQEVNSITVTIDGVPTTITDGLASSKDSFTILSELTTVGEPDSSSYVYDIPQRDLSDSPFPVSRSALYHMFPNYTCVTKSCWERFYGETFDQTRGNYVISPFKRTFDPFLTVCTDPRRVYDGSQCTIRDRNLIDCPTNNTCVFTKKAGRFLYQGIVVPGEEITSIVLSECPVVITDRRPAATLVTLTNQQNFPVTVKVVIEGPCPDTKLSVGIPAVGSTALTIPLCNNAPSTRPLPSAYWSNLTVYRLVGLEYVVCNTSVRINVTGDREAVLTDQGLVDLGLSRKQTIVMQDPVMVQIIDQLLQNQVATQVANARIATVFDALLLTDLPVYNDILTDVISGGATLINTTVAGFNETRKKLDNISITAITDVSVVLDELLKNNSLAIQQSAAQYLQLKNLSALFDVARQGLANATVNLFLTDQRYINATFALARNTIAWAEGMQNFASSSSFFDFMKDVAGGFVWVFDQVAAGAEWVVDKAGDFAGKLIDLVGKGLESMSRLFNILTIIVPAIIGVIVIFIAFRWLSRQTKNTDDLAQGAVRSADGAKIYKISALAEVIKAQNEALLKLTAALEGSTALSTETRGVIASASRDMERAKQLLPTMEEMKPRPPLLDRIGLTYSSFFKPSVHTPAPPPPAAATNSSSTSSSVVAAILNSSNHAAYTEFESTDTDEDETELENLLRGVTTESR